ncbi:MAG: tRNA (adenosine(37)-N6)-threonylcarbamoyltransferase complex ATPase subunit type 1 TsaE [Azoarcus sp.]|jgi:tRNA threonylcarbamoyladenosine biosynthesis protein TsaE|nr:tRNA (adenosine(37)-N6)-threonylcarbamoyltransferase complex ATPase subunit type 1 TsaE [Azoarcus sp.]
MTASPFVFAPHPDEPEPDSAARAWLAREADTLALGARIAGTLAPGLHIWLEGGLGSGKTTLARGLLRALGHTGPVKSPTYTLIELYALSRITLYHFDFYRLTTPEEFLDAGLDEYFSGTGICLVEWPRQAVPCLGDPDIIITLAPHGGGRQVTIQAKTATGRTCIRHLTGSTSAQRTAPPG